MRENYSLSVFGTEMVAIESLKTALKLLSLSNIVINIPIRFSSFVYNIKRFLQLLHLYQAPYKEARNEINL